MYYQTSPFFGETDLDTPAGVTLRTGSRGPAVAALQRKLNRWANQSGLTAQPLVEDGNFGPITATRVRSFQQAVGLTPDGVAGAQTQQQLDRVVGGSGFPPQPVPSGSPRITPSECDRIRQSCELLARFDFDKSDLRTDNPNHRLLINNITQCVADSFGTPTPIRSILVIGHTDTRGADWHNCSLGQRRAATVKTALAQAIANECSARSLRPCPISISQILTQSFGKKQAIPELPGDDPQNRRVEVCLFTTPTPKLRPGACSATLPPKPPKLDCTKTPQDPRCRKPHIDCSVQSHPDCPPDCARFPEDPRCPKPPTPPPTCNKTELDGRLKECIKEYAARVLKCQFALDAILAKIKLVPGLYRCTKLGSPYAIAACALAVGGKDIIDEFFRQKKCVDDARWALDQCRFLARLYCKTRGTPN